MVSGRPAGAVETPSPPRLAVRAPSSVAHGARRDTFALNIGWIRRSNRCLRVDLDLHNRPTLGLRTAPSPPPPIDGRSSKTDQLTTKGSIEFSITRNTSLPLKYHKSKKSNPSCFAKSSARTTTRPGQAMHAMLYFQSLRVLRAEPSAYKGQIGGNSASTIHTALSCSPTRSAADLHATPAACPRRLSVR